MTLPFKIKINQWKNFNKMRVKSGASTLPIMISKPCFSIWVSGMKAESLYLDCKFLLMRLIISFPKFIERFLETYRFLIKLFLIKIFSGWYIPLRNFFFFLGWLFSGEGRDYTTSAYVYFPDQAVFRCGK